MLLFYLIIFISGIFTFWTVPAREFPFIGDSAPSFAVETTQDSAHFLDTDRGTAKMRIEPVYASYAYSACFFVSNNYHPKNNQNNT